MEPFSKRARVEGPGADAIKGEDAITFHLLRKDPVNNVMVLDAEGHFPPDMTHQLFGEKEEVVGYDGLSIDIWLSPQFQTFVDVKYAGKGPGATDLKTPFKEAFAAGFFEEKGAYDKALQEESQLDLSILGQEVASRPAEGGSTIKVFRSHLSKADPKLKELHARMEPLLLFFVDAAAGIDPEDEGWHLFTAVEVPGQGAELPGPIVLGFATAYRFWHYPAGSRLRLAQILVLPPHQGRGAGAALLGAVQGLADELEACDLAFEDPAEGLQSLRTFLDVRRALQLEWVQDAAAQRIAALAEANKGKGTAGATINITANGSSSGGAGGSAAAAARAAAAAHPLAAPAGVLDRLHRELRLSKLQASLVWRVLMYVAGQGQAAVAEGVKGLILQSIVAQAAEAKGDAQAKSVLETDKGFVMCRGANRARREVPLLPVEEASVEQQAEEVQEAAAAQAEFVAGVAAKFLGGAGGAGGGRPLGAIEEEEGDADGDDEEEEEEEEGDDEDQ